MECVDENDVLPLVDDIFAEPGRQLILPAEKHGRTMRPHGGEALHSLIGSSVLRQDFYLYRASGAWWLPKYGTIIVDGRVMNRSHAEAAYFAKFPKNRDVFAAVLGQVGGASARRMKRAFVSMPWGGTRNYGHFLIDCLPALASFKSIAPHSWWAETKFPPLTAWQRAHLERLRIEFLTEIEDEVVYVEDIMWSNAMDHYLQSPNVNVLDIRQPRAAPPPPRDKIFITRGTDDRRSFPGSADLDAVFESLGFLLVEPSTLGIAEQIALFEGARVVSGLTGAGFANTLFCQPDATVIEIMTPALRGAGWRTWPSWLARTTAITTCLASRVSRSPETSWTSHTSSQASDPRPNGVSGSDPARRPWPDRHLP